MAPPTPSTVRRPPGHEVLLWGLIALGVALRFVFLTGQSLWTDEVESLVRSTGDSLGAILRRTANDFHPPLFFVLLGYWRRLGESDWVARSLPALIGSLFLPVAYALGLRLGGRRIAYWALALAVLSPLQIWYSQEVRHYGLLLLLGGVVWLAFLRVVERPTIAGFAALGVTFLAGVATHFYFAFVSLAQLPALLVAGGASPAHLRRRLWVGWLAAHAVAGALLAPVIVWKVRAITGFTGPLTEIGGALGEMSRMETGNIEGFSLAAIPYAFYAWSVGYSLGPSLEQLHFIARFSELAPWKLEIALVAILFGTAALLAVLALRRQPFARAAILGGALIPVLTTAIMSAFTAIAFHPRYALAGFPLSLILLAWGVAGAPPRAPDAPGGTEPPRERLKTAPGARGALGASLLAVSALATVNYYFDPTYAKEDARAVLAWLEPRSRPGDVVVLNTYPGQYSHYLRSPRLRVVRLPGASRLPLFEAEGLWYAPLRPDYVKPATLGAYWAAIPGSKGRVWLVMSRRYRIDPTGAFRRFLEPAYRRREARAFPQVVVVLLERR